MLTGIRGTEVFLHVTSLPGESLGTLALEVVDQVYTRGIEGTRTGSTVI